MACSLGFRVVVALGLGFGPGSYNLNSTPGVGCNA